MWDELSSIYGEISWVRRDLGLGTTLVYEVRFETPNGSVLALGQVVTIVDVNKVM